MPDPIDPLPAPDASAQVPRLGEVLLQTMKGLSKPIFKDDGRGGIIIADDALDVLEEAAHGPFSALASSVQNNPAMRAECIALFTHAGSMTPRPSAHAVMRILMTQISLYLLGLENMGKPTNGPS